MEKFELVLGSENKVLPGKAWTQYTVEMLEEEMVCTSKKDENVKVVIKYAQFTEAEFGIGSGNLWLQCKIGDDALSFCSPRKCWKNEAGKYLIDKINAVTEIKGMKDYKKYTGPFFFLAMFK